MVKSIDYLRILKITLKRTKKQTKMSKHTLMFGWEYPPRHLGGLGVACQGLVRGLLGHGAKITLVLPSSQAHKDNGMEVVSPTEEHIRTVRINSNLQPYDSPTSFAQNISSHTDSEIPLYGEDLGHAVHEFTECAVKMTKDTKPDVVHSHDWMTFEAGRRAAKYHNVPFVAQIHATELDRTHFKPNQWIYNKEKSGLEAADHIITVSGYTKNILIKEYGIDSNKIEVVHNGAYTAFDTPPPLEASSIVAEEKHPLILFLGRLTVQKGAFHFLEAARLAHNHNPDIRFVVAGEGYLLGELIDRACEMGLRDTIMFAGKVSSDEAKKLYKQASCFVMPSTSEPFGLVALEAITHETPVIVSKQSGVSEVLNHSFQIDFWDIDKLSDCMLTVIREKPLAAQLRSQALSCVHKLSWENQAAKVLSVYNKILPHD
jgi:glycosyltransferase involved in cell wall biosynthesis